MAHRIATLTFLSIVPLAACFGPTVMTPPLIVVEVSSLLDPAASAKKSYALFSGREGVDEADLHYREFAPYVRTALTEQGFVEAQDPTTAALAIFIKYGIGEPRTTYFSYSYPVIGMVGGGTSNFTASTFGSGGYSTTSGTIRSSPRAAVVGVGSVLSSKTTYLSHLELEAVDADRLRAGEIAPIWKITVTSSGESNDLRRFMPVLVAAGAPYIAHDTGQKVKVLLAEEDPTVLSLKYAEQLSATSHPIYKAATSVPVAALIIAPRVANALPQRLDGGPLSVEINPSLVVVESIDAYLEHLGASVEIVPDRGAVSASAFLILEPVVESIECRNNAKRQLLLAGRTEVKLGLTLRDHTRGKVEPLQSGWITGGTYWDTTPTDEQERVLRAIDHATETILEEANVAARIQSLP